MKNFLLVALLTSASPSWASVEKIPLTVRALPATEVHDFSGFVGARLEANRTNYLATFDIDHMARLVEEKKTRDWFWIGEQPGKWLESTVLDGREFADTKLTARARQILARLVAAQEPGGYLGVTDPAVRTDAQPLRGMDAYELYFTLHGLLTASEILGDTNALTAARRLGDYFVAHIGAGKAEFWPSDLRPPENLGKRASGHSQIAGHSVHQGFEGTLLIDPMTRLYQITGDQKYLDWSQWVVSRMDAWSGSDAFTRMGDLADGKIGVHQLQPYVHAHTFQMNFLGLLRLYRVTGDASLLRKVRAAWDDIAARQVYITGGVSVAEHYEPGFNKPLTGEVVETCANMSWAQLSLALYELTGDAKYHDAIERLLWNHVFAAQTVDGDCSRYHTPPNGFKPDDYFHGPDCCTSSGHRLLALLPEFFYAQTGDAIIVNQFVASRAEFQLGKNSVTLRQETSFPETETVRIIVEPSRAGEFAVQVRLPAWCEHPTLAVNGKEFALTNKVGAGERVGHYATIRRVWKNGDVITLTLPMTVQWVSHEHFPDTTAPLALVRGPVVYALDTVWWDDAKLGKAPFSVAEEVGVVTGVPQITPTGARALGPFFRASVDLPNGQTGAATFVPFANIGRWYRDDAPKPELHSRAYSYGVWLFGADSDTLKRKRTEQKQIAALLTNSVDFVLPGDTDSERAHKIKGTNSHKGIFQDRAWRDATAGGFFQYAMKVSTEVPTALVVTYWGGDAGGREFDVLVNDRVVGHEILAANRPGKFYETSYAIPFDLITGQTDALGQKVNQVRVKFQARSGKTAGGLYGLRVVTATNP
jgi:DUF1680 family protein